MTPNIKGNSSYTGTLFTTLIRFYISECDTRKQRAYLGFSERTPSTSFQGRN